MSSWIPGLCIQSTVDHFQLHQEAVSAGEKVVFRCPNPHLPTEYFYTVKSLPVSVSLLMNDCFYFLWGIVTMNKEGKGFWGLIKWNSFVTRKTQEKLRNWDGRELKKRGHITQGHFKEGAFREPFTVFGVLLEKLVGKTQTFVSRMEVPQTWFSHTLSCVTSGKLLNISEPQASHRESRDEHLSLIGLWILHESIHKAPSTKHSTQWVLNKYEFPLLFV